MRRVFFAVSILAIAMLGAAGQAQASSVRQCDVTSAYWTFNGGLTTTFVTNGTATMTYTTRCIEVDSSGAVGIVYPPQSSFAETYNGSCVHATLSRAGTTGDIIAGTQLTNIYVGSTIEPSTQTLDPTTACQVQPNQRVNVMLESHEIVQP
jgi:hypothetical protein